MLRVAWSHSESTIRSALVRAQILARLGQSEGNIGSSRVGHCLPPLHPVAGSPVHVGWNSREPGDLLRGACCEVHVRGNELHVSDLRMVWSSVVFGAVGLPPSVSASDV